MATDPISGRDETETERLDRNWGEILQELRVTQTGTQILTGFLLAVAFQQRFTTLDPFATRVYLTLVILAVLTTGLGLAPVSLHRTLFHRRAKARIVAIANVILRCALIGVALLLSGTVLLIFDLVVDRSAGLVAGALTLTATGLIGYAIPVWARPGRPEPYR